MKRNKKNPPQYEWGPVPFGDGGRILDIRYDPVFKTVFTRDTAKSRAALSNLISALIGRSVTVETITNNEPAIDDIRQRYLRFDVACKTGKGEPINVEMSFNPKASEPVRLEYHVARLFTGQDFHGKDKSYNDLKETYQIAILAKQRFFPDENFAHNFLYYDPDNRVPLGGKTRIITMELVKTGPIIDKPVEEMTNAELWAVFFQYLTDEEKRGKIIEIINREEGIALVVETLGTFTQSELEYIRESGRIKAEYDHQTDMAEARAEARSEGRAKGLKEGRAEGRKEGIEKEKLEIARKMKKAGRPLSEIADFTGLPAETIEQL
jgi:predicted transposase/invertase (TIGR01784 family)